MTTTPEITHYAIRDNAGGYYDQTFQTLEEAREYCWSKTAGLGRESLLRLTPVPMVGEVEWRPVTALQLAGWIERTWWPTVTERPQPGDLDGEAFDTMALTTDAPILLAPLVDDGTITVDGNRVTLVDPEGFRRHWWPTTTERLADAVASGNEADGTFLMEQLREAGWTWAQISAVSHGPDADRTAAQVWYNRAARK